VEGLALKRSRCLLHDSLSELRNENMRIKTTCTHLFFQTGDCHCDYVLLYATRILEMIEDENVQNNELEDVIALSPMET
jgi:hypothetical protein